MPAVHSAVGGNAGEHETTSEVSGAAPSPGMGAISSESGAVQVGVAQATALEVAPTDQRTKNLLYKARTMLRDNLKALMARGVELANAGRAAEAKEKFTEVLKLSPGNAEATEYLSKLTGQATHAAVNKDEIKKLYYDGVSLYLDGQNRRAVEVWQKILVLDPDNQEAKSSIAKAEMELKEMEKRGIKVE